MCSCLLLFEWDLALVTYAIHRFIHFWPLCMCMCVCVCVLLTIYPIFYSTHFNAKDVLWPKTYTKSTLPENQRERKFNLCFETRAHDIITMLENDKSGDEHRTVFGYFRN